VCVQIVDDTLDLSPAPARLSKPDRDLRDGIYTLPVIYALRDSSELRRLLGGPLDDGRLAEVRSIVDTSRANDVALDIARSHAVKAARALEGSPVLDTDVYTMLIDFLHDIVAAGRARLRGSRFDPNDRGTHAGIRESDGGHPRS
jgi:geranylgeranyl pyrophosphate synthase